MCDCRDAEYHCKTADPMAYGHPKVCGHMMKILQSYSMMKILQSYSMMKILQSYSLWYVQINGLMHGLFEDFSYALALADWLEM
jgi:uncharacterized membrane protein YhfC